MPQVTSQTTYGTGLDPVGRVLLMENHDQAYYIWRDAGVKQKILIHIDAHHDMWWVKEKAEITIADFICPALREGIVREVMWVVPDATLEEPSGRKAVLRHLEGIGKDYPGKRQRAKVGPQGISLAVLGKAVKVCRLRSLARIEESVLLDIDIDYLLIPRVSYGETDAHGPLPWCWPEELLARLAAQQIRTDLATIVYSVEGGYTPLKWKYLGDELAGRLKPTGAREQEIEGFRMMRGACEAAEKGNHAEAEEKLQQATRLLPGSAAPHYHLAHLYARLGRMEEGRKAYQRVLDLDKTYRTPYNSAGVVYFLDKRFQEAEQEHTRTLALNPDDAYAHLGVAQLAARKKRWKEAEIVLGKSLALDPNLLDSYRLLGKVLAKQGREDEAIRAYERSLKLALTGHKPLSAPLLTPTVERPLLDPFIPQVHARLGRLYTIKGDISEAINAYRMSTAGGYDGVALRARLAALYLRQGKWKHATVEAWRAVKLIPAELKRVTQQSYRRVVRVFSRRSVFRVS